MDGVVSAAMALRGNRGGAQSNLDMMVSCASTSPAKHRDSRFSRRIVPLCASWKLSPAPHRSHTPHFAVQRTHVTTPSSGPFSRFFLRLRCVAYVSNTKNKVSNIFVVFFSFLFVFLGYANVSSGPSPSHLSVSLLSICLSAYLPVN